MCQQRNVYGASTQTLIQDNINQQRAALLYASKNSVDQARIEVRREIVACLLKANRNADDPEFIRIAERIESYIFAGLSDIE